MDEKEDLFSSESGERKERRYQRLNIRTIFRMPR